MTGNLWQFLQLHILRDMDRGADRNISKSNQVHHTTQYINEYSELLPNHNTFVSGMYKCGFCATNFSSFFSFLISLLFLLKLSICRFLTLFIPLIHNFYNNSINFLSVLKKFVAQNRHLYILH